MTASTTAPCDLPADVVREIEKRHNEEQAYWDADNGSIGHAPSDAHYDRATLLSKLKEREARIAELERERDVLNDRPRMEAYLRVCRALHWLTAELRAHGIEPVVIEESAPHYPPDGFKFPSGAAVFVERSSDLMSPGRLREIAADYGGGDTNDGLFLMMLSDAFEDFDKAALGAHP